MKKTLISLLLVVVLALALVVPAMAAAPAEVTLNGTETTITVSQDTYLDLAGHSLDTITIQNGAKLYLYDSTTDEYEASNAKVGTIEGGKPERAFVLPAGVGAGRYRYITIQEENGSYSAHRFYIGVTSAVLYPKTGSLYFKLTYRGNDTLTGYVDQFGGYFGASKNIKELPEKPLTSFSKVETTDHEFTWTVGIGEYLNPEAATGDTDEKKLANTITVTAAYINARACLRLNDEIGTEVTSSITGVTFQDAVLEAQKQVDGMTAAQVGQNVDKIAVLTGMYQDVLDAEMPGLLEAWSEGETRIPYYCVCGASLNGGTHKTGCNSESILWTPYNKQATTGNYYLTADFENHGQVTTDAGSDIKIDLNGHNVTASGRAFWEKGSLLLCNTAPAEGKGIVSGGNTSQGGVIWFNQNNSEFKLFDNVTVQYTGTGATYGGAIAFEASVSGEMYGGKIIGGAVSKEKGGGAVYQSSGSFTMHSGEIKGGTATVNGGAVYTAGNFEMKGGTVYGGSAHEGGNVYIAKGGKLTMSGDAEITGGTVTYNGSAAANGGNVYVQSATNDINAPVVHLSENAKITGGMGWERSDDQTANRVYGGNVYFNNSCMIVEDNAKITGGNANYAGGNIHCYNATLVVKDNAEISGGTVNKSTTSNNADIAVWTSQTGAAKVIASGGTIGYISVNRYSYNSSNPPAIEVAGSAKIHNLRLDTVATITVTDALTKDAFVRVTDVSTAGAKLATIADTANLDTNQAALAASRIQGSTRIGGTVTGTTINLSSKPVNHCVCGAAAGEVRTDTGAGHANGCDKKVVEWTAYASGNNAGNYYLTADWSGNTRYPAASATTKIDLNGYNMTVSGGRAFQISNTGVKLWFCNTAPAKEGTGIISGTGTSSAAQGGVIWAYNDAEINLLDNVTIKLADDQNSITYGGAVLGQGTATINMYGGKIIGRNVTQHGAAVALIGNSSLTMHDGEIIGGNAGTYGGAVSVNVSTASFTMKGGKIVGGTTTEYGGAVAAIGDFTMEDGTIIGGTAGTHGGAVYVNKSFIMDDGTINGGTSNSTGGAVYVASAGSFTMNDGTIKGGSAVNGGAVGNNGSFTMNDGKIDGGTASSMGGAVYVGKSFTMNGGEIIGGTSESTGGAVHITGGNSFTMKGGTITGGTAKTNGGAVCSNGTVEIDGTDAEKAGLALPVIKDGVAASKGGNVYIGQGTFKLTKGTIQNGTVGNATTEDTVYGGNLYFAGTAENAAEMKDSTIIGGRALGKNEGSHGGNLYIAANRTFNMENGSITGGMTEKGFGGNVNVVGGAILNISGNATITGGTSTRNSMAADIFNMSTVTMDDGHIGKILTSHSSANATLKVQGNAIVDSAGFDGLGKIAFGEKVLGDEASITVAYSKTGCIYEVAEGGMNAAKWQGLVGNLDALKASSTAKIIQFLNNGIYLSDNADGAIICPFGCTEHNGGVCLVGTSLPTFAISSANDFPIKESGYYYLTNDITRNGQFVIQAANADDELDVILDLNGYKLSSSRTRALQIWNNVELTLVNTSNFKNQGTQTRTGNGGIIEATATSVCDPYAIIQTAGGAETVRTINLYDGVTLKKSGGDPVFNCGGIYLSGNTTFNMYGGTVEGGPVQANAHSQGTCGNPNNVKDHAAAGKTFESGNGGAFYISAGCTLNVYGGTIVGNTVDGDGGVIYNKGTANLNNVTISGGNAKNGGAIYNTGTLTMNGVTVGGEATELGDSVYTTADISLNGDLSITGQVYSGNNKLILGEDLNIVTPFTYNTNWLEGYVTSGTPVDGIDDLIIVEGKEQEERDGHLFISPLANEGELLVGFGEASVNPTDDQKNWSKEGYKSGLDGRSGTYPLYISGHGHNPVGTTVASDNGAEYAGLDLKATAIAYSDHDGDVIVMISVDALTITSPVAMRREVAAAVGVPIENVMISATHIHSAPTVNTTKTFYDKDGVAHTLSETYYDTFLKGLKDAAIAAVEDRKAVDTLQIATVENVNTEGRTGKDYYDFNQVRNYKAYDTNYRSWMGENNYIGMYTPNHVDYTYLNGASGFLPESEVDDSVQLVKYTFKDRQNPIVIANFQCHPVLFATADPSYERIMHSDVAGAFRTALARELGADVAYFSGASGNVQSYAENKYNQVKNSFLGSQHRKDKLPGNLDSCNTWGNDLAEVMNKPAIFKTLTGFSTNVAVAESVVLYDKNVDTELDDAKLTDGTKLTLADRRTMAQAIKNQGMGGKFVVSSGTYDDDLYSITFAADFCNPCPHVENGTKCPFIGTYNANRLRSEWKIYSYFHATTGLVDRMYNNEGDKAQQTLYAYAAGPIAFAAAPYEMFDTNGYEVKRGSAYKTEVAEEYRTLGYEPMSNPFAMTIVATKTASSANEDSGYVPSRIGFANGGYSTDVSPYAAGTGELFVTEFLAMLNGLSN